LRIFAGTETCVFDCVTPAITSPHSSGTSHDMSQLLSNRSHMSTCRTCNARRLQSICEGTEQIIASAKLQYSDPSRDPTILGGGGEQASARQATDGSSSLGRNSWPSADHCPAKMFRFYQICIAWQTYVPSSGIINRSTIRLHQTDWGSTASATKTTQHPTVFPQ